MTANMVKVLVMAVPVWASAAEWCKGDRFAAGACIAAGVACAWALWWPKRAGDTP